MTEILNLPRLPDVPADNSLGLVAGDNVRIRPYKSTNLYGDSITPSDSGREGQIVKIYCKYDWYSIPDMAMVRMLTGDDAWVTSRPLGGLDLISKGQGFHEVGVTHPFSERELRQQRLSAFDARIKSFRGDYNGWSNAATEIAFILLNNDSAAMHLVNAVRRRDGTVNPTKVARIFADRKLLVDEWAFEPALEVPAEFTSLIHSMGWRQKINWDELAVNLAEKIAA